MEKPWKRVFRGLVDNNPMLYRLNRVMYDEKTARIIDKLTTMKIVGIHKRVSKELNLLPIQFKRLLSRFLEYNFEFTIDLTYLKVGLIEYLLFIKNKYVEYNELLPFMRSWLRSYTKIFIPKGTLVTMYLPHEYKNEVIKRINEWFNESGVDGISSFIIVHRLQPSFTKHEPSNHPLYKGYETKELEEMLNNAEEKKPNWFLSENDIENYINNPNDVLDLLLLKELESNAFVSINTVSQKYNIRMKTFRKHLIHHIIKQNVINGIYLKSHVFIEAFGSPILLLLKIGDRSLYYKWVNFFDTLENTLSIAYSPYSSENVLYVVLSRTYRFTENIKSFLVSKATAGLIEELIPLEYTVGSTIRYTIPYRNFDQDSRSWSIDLDSAHTKIERRIFKK